MIFEAEVGGQTFNLELRGEADQPIVEINGMTPHLDLVRLSTYTYSLIVDGQSHTLSISPHEKGYEVTLRQQTYRVQLRDELDMTIERLGLEDRAEDQGGKVIAPIPGLVTAIKIKVGDEVHEGDSLLVLEAMKMENDIISHASGKVIAIHVEPGTAVEKGTLLLELGE